jgi:uncharacterized membrane-anchored protein
MKRISWIIIIVNLLALLAMFNYSIASKEQLLQNGQQVLLELAPVDPRSLMQGDYMQLRYRFMNDIGNIDSIPKRGFAVVTLDANKIASFVRFQTDVKPLANGEFVVEYNKSRYSVSIGAESFFFQEGKAAAYDSARYGAIRIDEHGKSILTGLYNRQLKPL